MEKIKVVIYDDPSETSFPLTFSLKNIKSKVKLLHFSRSPNLSTPSNLPCFRYSNRKSWILHNVFNGIFDHVIWFHPNKQNNSHLKDRFTSNYFIGLDKNQMATDVPDPYFYNSGEFSCSNHMRNRVNFKLSVTKIHEFNTSCPVCVELSSSLLSQPFALHLDLSLFYQNSLYTKGLDEILELNRIYRLYAVPVAPKFDIPLKSPAMEVIDHGLKIAQIINDERRNQLNQIEQVISWLISADDLKWEDVTINTGPSPTNSLVVSVHEVYDIVILLKTYFLKYNALSRRLDKISRDCSKIIEKYANNSRVSMPQMALLKKVQNELNPSSPTITDADWFHSSQTCLSIKEFSMKLHKCFSDCSNRPANVEHENIPESPEVLMNSIESTMNRFYNPSLILLSRQSPFLPEASSHHTLLHLSRQQQLKKTKNSSVPCATTTEASESQPTANNSNAEYALQQIQQQNDQSDRLFSEQINSIKMLSRIYGKKNLTFELNYPGCVEDAKKLQALGYEAIGIDQPPVNKILSGTNSLSEFSFDWSIDDETEAESSIFEWSISQKKEPSSGRDNPNILSTQDANSSCAALEPGRKEIL